MRGIQHEGESLLLALKVERPHEKECGQPLGAESSSKEKGTFVLQHKDPAMTMWAGKKTPGSG